MRLDWDNFHAIHGKNANDEFEVLSGMLVENIEKGTITNTPTNYKGIESEPFKNTGGKKVAYQSKFFSNNSESSQINEFLNSLKKLTKEEVEKIDILYLTSNKLGASPQGKLKTKLENHFESIKAKKPEIKFVCGITRFKGTLLKDRAFNTSRAYFFGGGNPRGLHAANLDEELQKILSENKYVELEMKDIDETYDSNKLLAKVLRSNRANILLMASAGTGKSRLLQKIAHDFAALDKDSPEIMQSILKHGVVVFLRASLCKGKSLHVAISEKLGTYGLSMTDYPITVVLDGLDELNLEEGTTIINELQDLYTSKRIARSIASVRTASSSSTRFQQVMSPHLITIEPLDTGRMSQYFEKKGNKEKTKQLKELIQNKADLSDISDIRILELYWESIKKGVPPSKPEILNAAFTSNTKSRTDGLNLLDPKAKSLKHILERLSVDILKKGGRTIKLTLMQDKILQMYDRMTYQDVNNIIDLMAGACGEPSDFSGGEDFTFEHKSWIDYFAALYLTGDFEDRKDTLLQVIDYEDVLSNWFVPVARYEYRRRNLLPLAIAIGVVESYLNFESDRTDESDEQIIKIRLGVNDEALRESTILYAEQLISKGIATSPKIIYEYLEAGHKTIAEKLHKLFCDKLDEGNNEFASRAYWNNMSYFYLLQTRFSTKSPEAILKRFNEIIEQYVDSNSWDIKSRLSPTVVKIYTELHRRGVGIETILKNMSSFTFVLSLGFIYSPAILRQIIQSDSAKNRLKTLLESSNLEPIDQFCIMSLLGLPFEDEEAVKAAYREKNDSVTSRIDDTSSSFVRLYLIRKAFGWAQDFDSDIEPHDHLMVEDIFDLLFSFAIERDFKTDFSTLVAKLGEALSNTDSLGRNRDSLSRRANTELITYLAQQISIQNTKKLIKLNDEHSVKFFSYSLLLEEIFEADADLFKRLFRLQELEDLLGSQQGNLESYSDELRSKAVLIATIDPSKAADLLNEIRRLTRLRYGYHKDILGFFLTTALEGVWEKGWHSHEQKRDFTKKIYRAILHIQDITDHDEVGWLPDEFFEILIRNDFELALEYFQEYSKENYDMPIIDQINIARVRRGDNFQDIKQLITRYRPQYMTQDRIFEGYFESRFSVLVNVAMNNQYSRDERIEAIKLASDELKRLKEQDADYRESDYERGMFLKDAIRNYRKLKSSLVPSERLESFPRKKVYKQQESAVRTRTGVSDLDRQIRNAKRQFNKLPDAGAYKRIIKDIKQNQYSRYNSLIVESKKSVDTFIALLEKNKEPYTNFAHLINAYLISYMYGDESQYFVYKIWNSSVYRHEFIAALYEQPHHYDTNQLLKVWLDSNEKELASDLIMQIVGTIQLLVRKT